MSAKPVFSAQTIECLRLAGWSPGRRVAVDAVAAALSDSGAILTAHACDFLSEFYGLRIRARVVPPVGQVTEGYIFIEPEVIGFDQDYQDLMRRLTGERVCPLGYSSIRIEFLMTESGRVVFTDQDWLTFGELGANYVEALEAMCDGRYFDVPGVYLDGGHNPSGSFDASPEHRRPR